MPGCFAVVHPPTMTIGDYFGQFYESVKDDKVVTWSSEYASRIVRHTFDRTSPISQYATVPAGLRLHPTNQSRAVRAPRRAAGDWQLSTHG